jgi:hypothetical protein
LILGVQYFTPMALDLLVLLCFAGMIVAAYLFSDGMRRI